MKLYEKTGAQKELIITEENMQLLSIVILFAGTGLAFIT